MINDLKYILKKVIIGFAIGVLMFFFRNSVFFAASVSITSARYTYANSAMTSNASFADATNVSAFTGVWLKGQPRYRKGINKVAFEINNNTYFSDYKNSPYNYSFYIVMDDPTTIPIYTNTLPTVEFNSVACNVMTSYWNNQGSIDGELANAIDRPGEIYGGWYGVVCPDITLTSNISYVNVYFQAYNNLAQVPFDFYLARNWNVARSGTIDALYQLIDLERQGNTIASSQTSAIQQQTTAIQQQTQAQQETNNLLKDTSTPSSSDVTNVTDKITNNNANVSDLVNMIPNTLQVIVNGFQNGCSGGYSLGTLFGTELIIPCINPEQYLGSFLWGVIDAILCLCYLIPFAKFLVNKYNDLTSLKNARFE